MSLGINYYLSSNSANTSAHLSSMKWGNKMLVSDTLEALPKKLVKDIDKVASKVVQKKEINQNIKDLKASRISLMVKNKKLCYSLGWEKDFKAIEDSKIQKAFKKVAKKSKTFLLNTNALKHKDVLHLQNSDKKFVKSGIEIANKRIVKSSPSDIKKIPIKYFKGLIKADTEWSLWAVWISDIQSAFGKIFDVLNIKADWSFLDKIKGWDDWLGFIVGFFGLINGIDNFIDAKKIGDTEGIRDGRHKIYRNLIWAVSGSFDWAAKLITSVARLAFKTILTSIAFSIFIFVTLYAMGRYGYFDIKALQFKSKFKAYLNNPNLSEKDKKLAALRFLKSKIQVSKIEAYKILKNVRKNNPNETDETLQKIVHQIIKNRVLTKIKRFERRVGSNVANVIQKDVNKILKNQTILSVEKTNKIIQRVQFKNGLAIHDNTLYAIASFLQAIEIFIILLFGFTYPVLIPGAISAALFVYLQGASFYRSHITKIDKEDSKGKLAKKIGYLAENAI
ncbi:MAG: hypothetical protein KR126chlam6_00774 [Candidatus Anoxychlamydiales bacterium]|nr:hypothetical protein [Candidatus Anoxychlamydiales bacterium]